jgi:hypothetical protein
MVLKEQTSASLNLLKIGRNDLGQLNSEFYLAFKLSDRFTMKGGLSHYFISYQGEHTDLSTNVVTSFKAYNFYNLRYLHLSYTLWQK